MEKVVRCASPAHRLLERQSLSRCNIPPNKGPSAFFNVDCVGRNGANAKLPSTQCTDLPRPARLLLPEHSRCTSRCAVWAPVARNNWFPSNPSTEKSAKKGRSPRKTLRRAPLTSCDTSGRRRARELPAPAPVLLPLAARCQYGWNESASLGGHRFE